MSDLIDRQAAIDDLHGKDPSQIWDTADIEVWVNALPSAQPERKTGEWREHIFDGIMGRRPRALMCANCNVISIYASNFCPNCGADMREDSHD